MGQRLSKIITRTGDQGTTGLANGERIAKNHLRIHVIGEVDELNSYIGYLLTFPLSHEITALLIDVQHGLFELGAELCSPGYHRIAQEMIVQLDTASQVLNANLPPLKEFILPGGAPVAAVLHIVRTVCRRAERSLVALQETDLTLNPLSLAYVNRLSDLCFILARHVNQTLKVNEPVWQPIIPPRVESMG